MDIFYQDILSLESLPAHLSYILLAVSYYMTNIFWLRAVAVAGLFLEILYFQLAGGNLGAGIAWDVIFILINVYHLYGLVRDRLKLRLPEKDAPLLRETLSGLDDAQIARLLKATESKSLKAGEVLTRQDAPLDTLYFLLSGRASVTVNGTLITYLERGTFIGEIAYLTGNPATATVVIEEDSRVLSFNRVSLAKVTATDDTINSIFYQILGRDLAVKMRRANTRRMLMEENPGV